MNATGGENYRQSELDKFGALAQRWWDPQGPQKALHALNPPRLAYVAARIGLPGARVLDVRIRVEPRAADERVKTW